MFRLMNICGYRIYNDGKAAFLNAVGRIDGNDAILLSKIVSVMVEENEDFKSSAMDIQARLALLIEE